MTTKPAVKYENNPFMIGIEGLKLIFTKAKMTGIYAIIVCGVIFVLTFFVYIVATIIDASSGTQEPGLTQSYSVNGDMTGLLLAAALIGIGTLIYVIVSLLLFGPLEYAAAMTAQGKNASLSDGFKTTLKNFPAYFWMYLIFTVKVMLWSLLFIVPGIIMFNRYILSGTVFFAEGKRGNAAIKRSSELTKGAWLTTYGGAWIWGIISQGITTFVFWPGQMAILYRQLKDKTDTNQPKPSAHVLSWLTLLVPLGLMALYFLFLTLVVVIVLVSGTTAP